LAEIRKLRSAMRKEVSHKKMEYELGRNKKDELYGIYKTGPKFC
jgi:hypothetical protein